jgi:sulfate permease, SulP family
MKKLRQYFWFLNYDRTLLRFDLIAGVTAAAVVIPKAMAYAVIAGLPVETGLYTAFVPLVVYGILGSSRQLSVSSTTVLAILTQAELAELPPDIGPAGQIAAAATLAFLAGVILVAASLLRLGFLGYFISSPVLTGFKAGVGTVIIVDQIPKLLGIHFAKTGFFRNIIAILHHIPDSRLLTVAVGVGTIVLMVTLRRMFPKFPAVLAGMGCAIGASAAFGLKELGVECVGFVPRGLPSISLPNVSLMSQFFPAAMGIALMSFIETVASGKAFLRPSERSPDANRDLLATGVANLCGGFFQIFPSGGGMAQTATNTNAGARSQAAGLVTAVITLLVMIFLSPVLSFIPLAALAAVIIFVSLPMLSIKSFRAIYRVRRAEFIWALVATVGVILFGVMNGVLIAVIVSILTLMFKANHPPVYVLGRKTGTNVFRSLDEHPQDVTYLGVLIIRMEGTLTFLSAPRAIDRFRELVMRHSPKLILLDLDAVPDIEYTALEMLDQGEQRLREHGIDLWLCALNPRALAVVRHSSLGQRLQDGRMYFDVECAIRRYLDNKGPRARNSG